MSNGGGGDRSMFLRRLEDKLPHLAYLAQLHEEAREIDSRDRASALRFRMFEAIFKRNMAELKDMQKHMRSNHLWEHMRELQDRMDVLAEYYDTVQQAMREKVGQTLH